MSPENSSSHNSESRDPQPLESVVDEVIEEIVDTQQQATDASRSWGSGATLVDAMHNLKIAERENTGDVTSRQVLDAAELRLKAARQEVLGEPNDPESRPQSS